MSRAEVMGSTAQAGGYRPCPRELAGTLPLASKSLASAPLPAMLRPRLELSTFWKIQPVSQLHLEVKGSAFRAFPLPASVSQSVKWELLF